MDSTVFQAENDRELIYIYWVIGNVRVRATGLKLVAVNEELNFIYLFREQVYCFVSM